MKIARLFEIVYILLDKESVKAKELAEKFEVSTRTIYRDVDVLSSCGIPIYTNKGKGGGISLVEGYKLNKAMLTKQEQSDVITALQSLSAVNANDDDATLSKLSTFFNSKQMEWLDIDFSHWNSGSDDKEKFDIIKNSIISTEVLQIEYSNSLGETRTREVLPLKLVNKATSWYLQAYCKEKTDFRVFKLSRIHKIQQINIHFERPSNIPILDKQERLTTKSVPVKLLVVKSMGFRIFDDFTPDHIRKTPTGDYILTINKFDEDWIVPYILTYENHATCIEPAHLRDKIRNILQKSLNNYL